MPACRVAMPASCYLVLWVYDLCMDGLIHVVVDVFTWLITQAIVPTWVTILAFLAQHWPILAAGFIIYIYFSSKKQ